MSSSTRWIGCLLIAPAAVSLACRATPAEPDHRGATASAAPEPAPTAAPAPAPTGDPLGGKFTLAQATEGLPGAGDLVATIDTSLGALECRLYADRAPTTVANFVGLARGKRPFRGEGGVWAQRPAYDGTVFHRIIKGFMIQGGDWKGTGTGDPGYVIPDEVWPNARHDRRGLICMANKGPNTNGMQFFITDGPAPHLDRGYTIFGECGPDSVIEAIASVPVRADRPLEPPAIRRVTVTRRATP
jgi:peptidyl-prolyl cis-trans isomerase A (cyclophilin A)